MFFTERHQLSVTGLPRRTDYLVSFYEDNIYLILSRSFNIRRHSHFIGFKHCAIPTLFALLYLGLKGRVVPKISMDPKRKGSKSSSVKYTKKPLPGRV
jgi:hypothetical protein